MNRNHARHCILYRQRCCSIPWKEQENMCNPALGVLTCCTSAVRWGAHVTHDHFQLHQKPCVIRGGLNPALLQNSRSCVPIHFSNSSQKCFKFRLSVWLFNRLPDCKCQIYHTMQWIWHLKYFQNPLCDVYFTVRHSAVIRLALKNRQILSLIKTNFTEAKEAGWSIHLMPPIQKIIGHIRLIFLTKYH